MDFRTVSSLSMLVTLGRIQNVFSGDKTQLHPRLLRTAPRVGVCPTAPVLTVVTASTHLLSQAAVSLYKDPCIFCLIVRAWLL